MIEAGRILACGLVVASLASDAAAQRIPEAEYPNAGRALALRLCTPCHVVSPDQETGPVLRQRTLSFAEIARQPGMTAEALRNFLATTHSTMTGPMRMPNPMLDEEQLTLIVSYILSLDHAAPPPRRDRPGKEG